MMLIYWQGVSWKIPWSGDSDVAEYFHKCLTFVWLALICVHSSLTLFRCSWCFCQICRPRQRCRPEWKHSSLRPTASRKSFNLSVETLLELYFCTFLHCFFLCLSLQMDGVSLHGMTNQEVLEVMKQTGQTVVLTLVRKKPRALERSLDKGRSDLFQLHVFVVQTSRVSLC